MAKATSFGHFLILGSSFAALCGCAPHLARTAAANSAAPSPPAVEAPKIAAAVPAPAGFYAAAAAGQADEVRRFLDQGTAVDAKNAGGDTVLILAAAGGHPMTVEMLLQAGADVNAVGAAGRTALIAAAKTGHTKVVRLLLRKHADPLIKARSGKTALAAAKAGGYSDIVSLIRAHETRLVKK